LCAWGCQRGLECAEGDNPADESGQFTNRDIVLTMFVNPDGVAEHTFRKLGDSIRFRVEGGDGRTDPVTVQVVKRPFLQGCPVTFSCA
jgi:hypothetical protein